MSNAETVLALMSDLYMQVSQLRQENMALFQQNQDLTKQLEVEREVA